jgi:replicative DNA helicase
MDTTNSNTVTRLPGTEGGSEPYRDPPVNYEAEQALLGAILANNQSLEKVADFLRPEHFAEAVHGRIFEACCTLIERNQLANAISLKNLFQQDEALAEVGGAEYLERLQGSYVSIINAGDYGHTIHDLHLRRQLIALGEDVVNQAFDHDLDLPAKEQIESAEQQLYNLAESGQTEGGFQPFDNVLTLAIEMAEAARKRDGHIAGVATEFADLDKLLGGLQRSDLVILASRPSMGKTSLATNIAFNAAKARIRGQQVDDPDAGAVVGFFSLEMSAEQLATRILSEASGVANDRIRRGELSDKEFDLVLQASNELSALPIFIDDTPAISVGQLRTRARRLKRQNELSLIVVDYLQLMRPTAGVQVDNRVQEISEITRGLKAIAKELDLPVLALSQLSRAVEQREDKRPLLSDLRESGSIEQDADVVMFIYREQYYLERAEPIQRPEENDDKFHERYERWKEKCDQVYGLSDIIVAKQRHGPIGTRKLSFQGATTKFSSYSDAEHLPDGDH